MRSLLLIISLAMGCNSDYDLGIKPPPEDIDTNDTSQTVIIPEDTDLVDTDEEVIGSKPIAVCTATPSEVTPPFETATFDGSQSHDPQGMNIVSWNWNLQAFPNGSSSFLAATSPWGRELTPDLAGDYIVRLQVETSDGRVSDAVDCYVEAVPGDNLWVEMYWVYSGDDMDLHLIRPNGSRESNGDCYYANCTGGLSWGGAGTADDPSLDIDDIPGTGPENINIAEPSLSGTYTVTIHDYPGSVYSGGNDVTVNIYIGGILLWTDTRRISGEDSYTDFAVINWPQRTVDSL